ncbi:hypothetical protein GII36_04330 [Candidatus Mycosynbacter amalyticus]|uniref:Uncharacterized protein n=1 Tax=Candidatus Mycosynbacter amalyticus TaxID=2665156 RepID=A0A857MKG8_9BACT|nr:hypothetical protein [Candidatus Mycosynbacter amalyticus]QHN43056.1 hypothetical protein GII36_04330 [Candidatus Mycosynbacter amalyticus]
MAPSGSTISLKKSPEIAKVNQTGFEPLVTSGVLTSGYLSGTAIGGVPDVGISSKS